MSDPTQATTDSQVRLTVVITTYERPDYLRESLATIAAQSARGTFRVVVLDNASVADYSGVIAEFADDLNLVYLRNETNIGAEGNILRALSDFRDAEYLTVFHDDDLMHPRMLEWQIDVLDEGQDIQFVATQFAMFADGQVPPFGLWENLSEAPNEVYSDAAAFVRGILSGSELCFSSVMYRTGSLDGVSLDFGRFGMYCDRPYLVSVAHYGRCALIKAPLVFYRTHGAQDSGSGAQSFSNLIELMKHYRDTLDVGNASDRELFRGVSNRFMIGAYGMLSPLSRPTPAEFLRRGVSEGVLHWASLSPLQWARILRAGLRARRSRS